MIQNSFVTPYNVSIFMNFPIKIPHSLSRKNWVHETKMGPCYNHTHTLMDSFKTGLDPVKPEQNCVAHGVHTHTIAKPQLIFLQHKERKLLNALDWELKIWSSVCGSTHKRRQEEGQALQFAGIKCKDESWPDNQQGHKHIHTQCKPSWSYQLKNWLRATVMWVR